jgi:DNA-binding CsgD family transcriptional regulator
MKKGHKYKKSLSFRERQVFWCLIAGMTYRQIGELLSLNPVKVGHLACRVYKWYNLHTRLQLVIEHLTGV